MSRSEPHAGGVCIYVKESLNVKIVCKSEPASYTEYLVIETVFNSRKLALGIIYRPPETSGFSELSDLLFNLSAQYSEIILTGDLNINFLNNSSHKKVFTDLLDTVSLKTVNEVKPTRITNSSATLIDYFLCSLSENVSKYVQFPIPGISDHDLLAISYKVFLPEPVFVNKSFGSFKDIDKSELVLAASRMQWDAIVETVDIDEKIEVFNNNLLKLLDDFAPEQDHLSNANTGSWFTHEIYIATVLKVKLFNKFRSKPSHKNKSSYHSQRNKVNFLIAKKKETNDS